MIRFLLKTEVIYMKKTGKKLAFTAAVMAAALNIGACTAFSPSDNNEPEVYGPPEDVSTSAEQGSGQTKKKSTGQKASEIEGLKFDEKDNKNEEVYGPPEDIESFDTDRNMVPCVYGPPEDSKDE
jgi:hypothetical protein